MPSRRRFERAETPADLPAEKAAAALARQLDSLQKLKGRNYQEAKPDEQEWRNLTEKLIIRSFGSGSANLSHFHSANWAGEHYAAAYGEDIPHDLYQSNYNKRIQAYEGVLNSCLAELKLDLPDQEIKGVYEAGEEYEFYHDVKSILSMAQKEIFVIDPYVSAEIFDVYASAIPRTVLFRLLSANIPSEVKTLAQKYAAGGNLQFRTSSSIHDRVLFADGRVWVCGQSLKDAAKKKPTYIVELDEPAQRQIYEPIWNAAAQAI